MKQLRLVLATLLVACLLLSAGSLAALADNPSPDPAPEDPGPTPVVIPISTDEPVLDNPSVLRLPAARPGCARSRFCRLWCRPCAWPSACCCFTLPPSIFAGPCVVSEGLVFKVQQR